MNWSCGRTAAFLWCLLAAAPGIASAAADDLVLWEVEYHSVPPGTDHLRLANTFVIPDSLRVGTPEGDLLPGIDFRVLGDRGIVLLLRPASAASDTVAAVRYLVAYAYRPALLPQEHILHPFSMRPEPARSTRSPLLEGPGPRALRRDYGDLEVRGSKSVRLASGNRRELTVDQNLRLDISGMLTEDIRVDAHLSDDDLPVVPEGSTEELRDVDRVNVRIAAPLWSAELGDFTAERRGTVFGDYQRKLQGVSVRAGDRHGFAALAGTPRGRYGTLQIRGEEAKQGPYYLGGGDTGRNLLIVAGSERVFLDGTELVRGSDRDYVIDYVRGTITFTYRRLVTAESEIVVEFEQGEGDYTRTTTGAEGWADVDLPGDAAPMRLSARLTVERDDADRPRFGGLDAVDRDTLAAAGDDLEAAVTSGLTRVAVGEGRYRLEQVAGVTVAVYDSLAGDHDVEFRHVGAGLGDYAVDTLTPLGEMVFAYQGAGGGTYAIGRALPLPSGHSLLTLSAVTGDVDGTHLELEWNASHMDRNILSSRDDGDNAGSALTARAGSGRRRLGAITAGLSGHHTERESRFEPFQNDRNLFAYDRWGLTGRALSPDFLEEGDVESEATAVLAIGDARRGMDLEGVLGRLEHGDDISARRSALAARWRLGRLDGHSELQDATARDDVDPLDARRERRTHRLGLDLGGARLGFTGDRDQYRDDRVVAPTAEGARNRTWRYDLRSRESARWEWSLSFTRGLADSSLAGVWRTARDSRTEEWRIGTPLLGGLRLTADGTVRDIHIAGGGKLQTRLAKLNLTGRWDRLGSDWSLVYGADNSRTEVLDRQVVYVGERQGDYDQAGDYVGYLLGDFRVVTVGTDSLVATTEAIADLTWRQDFGFLGRERVWGAWTSYTRASVRSRSRLDDPGRVLRFAPGTVFDDENSVLGEFTLRQEANLLRHREAWDLRLFLDLDQSLDRQYALHPENRLRRRHQGQLAYNIDRRSSLRWRATRTAEERRTQEASFSANRSYDSVELANRLEWQFRAGPGRSTLLGVDLIERDDIVSGSAQREVGARMELRQRLRRDFTLLLDLRYADVRLEAGDDLTKPYFYPRSGDNIESQVRLDWELSSLIRASLVYYGRKQGERGWQHDLRMESTARF